MSSGAVGSPAGGRQGPEEDWKIKEKGWKGDPVVHLKQRRQRKRDRADTEKE